MEFTIIKRRALTLSRSPQYRAFSRAVMGKSSSPLFPIGEQLLQWLVHMQYAHKRVIFPFNKTSKHPPFWILMCLAINNGGKFCRLARLFSAQILSKSLVFIFSFICKQSSVQNSLHLRSMTSIMRRCLACEYFDHQTRPHRCQHKPDSDLLSYVTGRVEISAVLFFSAHFQTLQTACYFITVSSLQ